MAFSEHKATRSKLPIEAHTFKSVSASILGAKQRSVVFSIVISNAAFWPTGIALYFIISNSGLKVVIMVFQHLYRGCSLSGYLHKVTAFFIYGMGKCGVPKGVKSNAFNT